MRTLLCSFAVLSALAIPLAAHANTYTGTATFTDLTHPSDLTGSFATSPFTFNDPSTSTITDLLTVTSNSWSDGDELQIAVSFTSPGTGIGDITGDADLDGWWDGNSIEWDSTSALVPLTNGSIVELSLPSDHLDLSGCGYYDRDCSCPDGHLCGSQNLTIQVTDNDAPPATPEPSSLALLGTGVLSVAGIVRRKIALQR